MIFTREYGWRLWLPPTWLSYAGYEMTGWLLLTLRIMGSQVTGGDWRSQTLAIHIQTPLFWRIQWFFRVRTEFPKSSLKLSHTKQISTLIMLVAWKGISWTVPFPITGKWRLSFHFPKQYLHILPQAAYSCLKLSRNIKWCSITTGIYQTCIREWGSKGRVITRKYTPLKTDMSPYNRWLVQMYSLLKWSLFRGRIR